MAVILNAYQIILPVAQTAKKILTRLHSVASLLPRADLWPVFKMLKWLMDSNAVETLIYVITLFIKYL